MRIAQNTGLSWPILTDGRGDERGDEGEDRQDDAVAHGLESVARLGGVTVGHQQPQRDAGDGRVHSGGVDQPPGDQAQRDEYGDHPGGEPPPTQPGEEGDHRNREEEWHRREVVGEEDRDDQDCDQIVDHRQGEQKSPNARGQSASRDREDAEGECDVGGCGDGPPIGEPGCPHDDEEYESRNDDAPDGRDRGHQRLAGGVQLAMTELMPELDGREEEEDGEQAVLDPVAHRQVQMQRFGPEFEVLRREQRGREGSVRENHPERRGADEQQRTDPLAPQEPHHAPFLADSV